MDRSLMDHPPYDHDVDGRPPTGRYGGDPLLEALVREHPELIPAELIEQLNGERLHVRTPA